MKTLIFVCLVILSGCSQINRKLGLPDDNLLEELTEDLIKEETGADIDLTPSTPEKKMNLFLNRDF